MATVILDQLRRIERTVIAVILLVLSAAFVINIAVRNLAPAYASSLAWIDELGVFALAWIVFLGLGLALERRQHIAMSVLRDRLPSRQGRVLGLIINAVGLVFSLYLAKLGIDITIFVRNSGQISPILDISMAWLYAIVPVGFALLALRYALALRAPAEGEAS